jgi:hypothetical protein
MNKSFIFLTLLVVGCSTTPHLNQPTTSSKFNPALTAPLNHNQIVEPAQTVPLSTAVQPIRGFQVGDVIHGFRLGASVATHRQNCGILNGKWDYVGEWCESPTIELSGTILEIFESPTIVAFNLGDFTGTVVKFVYLDETHTTLQRQASLGVWLDYCHRLLGEPSYKDLDGDKLGWSWSFNNSAVAINAASVGFMVTYALVPEPVSILPSPGLLEYYCRTTVTLPNRPFLECFSTLSSCNNSPTESDLPCISQTEVYCSLTSFSYFGGSDAVTCWANNDECVKFCQERQMSIPESPCISQCTKNLIPTATKEKVTPDEAIKMCIDGCRFAAQRCTSLAIDSVERAVCAQKKIECSGLCR